MLIVDYSLPMKEINKLQPGANMWYDDRIAGVLIAVRDNIAQYEITDPELIDLIKNNCQIDVCGIHKTEQEMVIEDCIVSFIEVECVRTLSTKSTLSTKDYKTNIPITT